MKIGIIGAAGKAGSLIAEEAIARGHEVTAIVRDAAKVEGKGFSNVLVKDIFDLEDYDLKEFQAVVCAVSLPSSAENGGLYQKAVERLIGVFRFLPDTRFLMVGGAASLYTDPGKQHQFLENIPENWRPVPEDMAKAFKKLTESDIDWSFFSPAFTFDPKGLRTGKYTLGSDWVITNASNESYISYADYAIAMVDEIENKFHARRRFTAVSDSKPEPEAKPEEAKPAEEPKASAEAKPAEEAKPETPVAPPRRDDGYYGILKKKPTFYGLSRYCPPFNFELAGKQFKLVMDLHNDFYVNFISGNELEWTPVPGEKPFREHYECAKIDELTYLVNFELTGVKPRTNPSLILDLEQRLVTYVNTRVGFSEKYPYLVDSDFDFGAIDIPGYPLPSKRHGYTTDLVGKRAQWTYGPGMTLVHVYYSPNYIRVAFPEGVMRPMRQMTPEEIEEAERFPYDEPTTYIKVKEGIYVVSVIEKNRSKRGDTGNSLLFLMDLIHVHDVGRSFGYTPPSSGAIKPENYLFAAFGDFVYSDGVVEARKNIYIE